MPNQIKKPFSTKTPCKVCGHTFTQRSTGRYREYCSDVCRDFNKYKNAFIDKLDAV
ncbi:MAG: hypothetical protein Q9M36_03045 [Sulfurovum sp.]|nr:hypothetical protein [Sulfurovum sp.]